LILDDAIKTLDQFRYMTISLPFHVAKVVKTFDFKQCRQNA